MVEGYRVAMKSRLGSAKVLISGDTLQVNDYDKWNWTMFNPDEKRARRKSVFPNELKAAFDMGAEMVSKEK
jgi:hypothetical protein